MCFTFNMQVLFLRVGIIWTGLLQKKTLNGSSVIEDFELEIWNLLDVM